MREGYETDLGMEHIYLIYPSGLPQFLPTHLSPGHGLLLKA